MQVKKPNEYQFPELSSKASAGRKDRREKNDVRQHGSFIGKWGYRWGSL